MRATLNIPDGLIAEVQRLSGQRSKTGAIVTVMQEYVQRKKMEEILALEGTIDIDDDWEAEEELELAALRELDREG